MWLIAVAIIVPLNLFVVPHSLLAILGVSGLVGVTVPWVRITIWRRRHPVISSEEYVDDMRKQAPWN